MTIPANTMTDVTARLLTKIDGAVDFSKIDLDELTPVKEEAQAYAKELIEKLPEDFLLALDSADGDIWPLPHGTIQFDWEPSFNHAIVIEIGKTSSSIHAWAGSNQSQSIEYSTHGDLAWLSFLQESFDKIRDTMTNTANMTKADPAS